MSFYVKKFSVITSGLFALLAFMSNPAKAYGPEGMFGGRLNPDSTVVLDVPVQPEDRPFRAQSVLQHPRPDYDPVPVTLGTFELFPSIEFGGTYDSNIYATPSDKVDDGIFNLRPTVSAFSNWNRHALSMTTYGDINFYADKTDENFNNYVTELQGRYDVMAQTWLMARGGFQHLAEPRSSPDAVAGSEPTTFDVIKSGLSAFRGPGKIKVGMDYNMSRFDFNDTPSSTGTIDQSGRNRFEHVVSTRVTYNLTENFKPYVKGGYNWRLYDHNDPHDSEGYEAVVGTTADFGGITSADVFVGWLSQDYDKYTTNNVNDGIKFGGRLEWNVTGMTSVVLEANRTIEETTGDDFNSYKVTGGSATVTHELLRNLLLEADMSFSRDDFQGVLSRQDDVISAGGGARWFINRNLYSDFIYDWTHRMSDVDGAGYAKHLVSVRLGVQM